MWGNLLNDLLSFLILSVIVYFLIVLPVNELLSRLKPAGPPPQPTRKCPECLSDIPAQARRCAFCTTQVSPEGT